MCDFGSNNPLPYPHASKNFQILFDIRIADNILGKVMKGIVCQTFSFCRIHMNVQVGVDSTPPQPLLGLMECLSPIKYWFILFFFTFGTKVRHLLYDYVYYCIIVFSVTYCIWNVQLRYMLDLPSKYHPPRVYPGHILASVITVKDVLFSLNEK